MSANTESAPTTTENAPASNTTVARFVASYKRDSRMALNILLLGMIGLIALLALFIFVQLTTQPSPMYFKENANMQIIEPVPMDQQGITKPALLNWVNEFIGEAFSFNYSNVYRQGSKVTPYLSSSALQQYLDLLATDQDFNTLAQTRYVVSVIPQAPPEIISDKAFRGRYAWQVRIPLKIKFTNALVKAEQVVTFDFLVWRVPETENPLGITIASFTRVVTSRSAPVGLNTLFTR